MNNYGWECPKCGRVYSPITPQCYYCGEKTTITSTDGSIEGLKVEWTNKDVLSNGY